MPQAAWLVNHGVDYRPHYRVLSDERLFRRLKSKWKLGTLKGRHKWKRVPLHLHDGRLRWHVKHPQTGKWHWVTAHRATLESFSPPGVNVRGLVAAHLPGTLPSDGALGTCVWKTHQGNRWDRRESKTGSTGHDTAPGKLTASDVRRLLDGWDAEPNVSMWARRLRCTRPNIRYHLERQGIPPRTS